MCLLLVFIYGTALAAGAAFTAAMLPPLPGPLADTTVLVGALSLIKLCVYAEAVCSTMFANGKTIAPRTAVAVGALAGVVDLLLALLFFYALYLLVNEVGVDELIGLIGGVAVGIPISSWLVAGMTLTILMPKGK